MKIIRDSLISDKSNSIYELENVFGDEEKFKLSSHRFNKLLEIIKDLKVAPNKVLDIGCGTGYLGYEINKIFPKAEIFGIDISNKALSIGKNKYPKINFVRADAEKKIPFNNEQFDLIISGEHLEHVKDTDTYAEEIYRVTKKNGTLIITTPNLVSWLNRFLVLIGKRPFYSEVSLRKSVPILSLRNFKFPDAELLPSGHLRLFTIESIFQLFKIYGFYPVNSYGISHLTKPIIKSIDVIMASFPTFATGLIVILKKR